MPVRLVSECLVNLLRVGWIELRVLGSETLFATTEAGGVAAKKKLFSKNRLISGPHQPSLYGADWW
jgi:hypothetical protein